MNKLAPWKTFLCLLLAIFPRTSHCQCGADDKWIFGHLDGIQITYEHFYVDPNQEDIIIAGYTESANSLNSNMVRQRTAYFEHYQNSANLGEVNQASVIDYFTLSGTRYDTVGIDAISGVPGEQDLVFLQFRMDYGSGLVFGVYDKAGPTSLEVFQIPNFSSNFACNNPPHMLQITALTSFQLAFKSCDQTNSNVNLMHVAYNTMSNIQYSVLTLALDSSFTSSRVVQMHNNESTLNYMFYLTEFESTTEKRLLFSKVSLALSQQVCQKELTLDFSVSSNGLSVPMTDYKAVALLVADSTIAGEIKIHVIMEKIDKSGELVFLNSQKNQDFLCSVDQFGAAALGGIFTSQQMELISWVLELDLLSFVSKDHASGKHFFVHELNLNDNSHRAILSIQGAQTGTSPLLTFTADLLNINQMQVTLKNKRVFVMSDKYLLRSVNTADSACYRYATTVETSADLLLTQTSKATLLLATTNNQVQAFVTNASTSATTFSYTLRQVNKTVLLQYLVTNPCKLRKETLFYDQVAEISQQAQVITDYSDLLVDQCPGGASIAGVQAGYMIEKVVDSNGNEYPSLSFLTQPKSNQFHLFTSQPNDIGLYTVHYRAAITASTLIEEFFYANTFQLSIHPASTCDKNLAQNPLLVFTFFLDASGTSSSTTYQISPLNHGGCYFSLVVKDIEKQPSWFVFTPPKITQVEISPNVWEWQTTEIGSYTVTTGDLTLAGSTKNVRLWKKCAEKNYDLDTKTTFEIGCTSNLSLSSISAQTYTLTSSAQTSTFAQGSNGNCFFQTSLTFADDSPLDTTIFTFTPEVLQLDSSNIYSLVSNPTLTISSSDLSHVGLHNLKLTISDAQNSQSVSQQFSVTVNEQCQTDGPQQLNTISSPILVEINTNALNQHVLSFQLANNNCGFSTTLALDSGAPITDPPFLFSAAQLQADSSSVFRLGFQEVVSDAELQIGTTDSSFAGQTFAFTLTVNSEQDVSDTRNIVIQFSVEFRVVTCAQVFAYPPHETIFYDILPSSAVPATYSLSAASNGDCAYEIELTIARTDFVTVDATMWSIQQPVLTPVANTVNIFSQTSAASLTISTQNIANQATYELQFKILSKSTLLDTQTQLFTKELVLREVCVPNLTVPTSALNLVYNVGDPALDHTFSGLSNGNCQYSTTLTNADSTMLPTALFTFTPPQMSLIAGSLNVYEISQEASLRVSTSDVSFGGPKSLLLTITQSDSPFDSLTFTFTVIVKIQCKSTSLTMPTVPLIRYRIQTSNTVPESYTLGPISNSRCAFSTSLLNLSGTPLSQTFFSFSSVTLTPDTDPLISGVFKTAQDTTLQILSSDTNNLGHYTLLLQANDQSQSSLVSSTQIQIELYSNPCLGSLNSIPLPNALDVAFQIQSPPKIFEYDLGAISNGECEFNLQIQNKDGTPLDQQLFQLVQPDFETKTGVADPKIVNVISNGKLFVDPYNPTTTKGTHTLILKINSNKEPYDVVFQSTEFVVTILCQVPSITETQNLSFGVENQIYTVFDAAITIKVKRQIFCIETEIQLVDSVGEPLDQSIFTVSSEAQTKTLQIYTDQISKAGIKLVKLQEIDQLVGLPIIEQLIQVEILDFCEGSTINASTNSDVSLLSGMGLFPIQWNSFEVSEIHKSKCQPIVYSVDRQVTSGENILEDDWFIVTPEKRLIEINTPSLSQDITVRFSITGTILGDISKYSSSETSFNVFIKAIQVEEVKAEPIREEKIIEEEILEVEEFEYEVSNFNLTVKENVKAPTMTIVEISNTGLVTVEFDKPLILQDYFKNIQKVHLEPNYTDLSESMFNFEVLSESDYILEKDPQAFAIKSTQIVSFSPTKLILDIVFENEKLVSVDSGNKDELLMTFTGKVPLYDKKDYLKVERGQKSKYPIPQQLTQELSQSLKELEKEVDQSMKVLGASNLIINIALSQTLKFVWNLVNLLQMAIFLPQWLIGFPEQNEILLKYLKSLVFLEFFDAQTLTKSIERGIQSKYDQIMISNQDSESDKNPDEKRYLSSGDLATFDDDKSEKITTKTESSDLVGKSAIMIIIGFIFLLVLLILCCLKPLIYYDYRIYRIYRLMKQKIFYNGLIRYALQSALKFEMAAFGTIYAAQMVRKSGTFDSNSVASWVIIVFFGLLPLFFGLVMYRRREDLGYPSVKNQIGSMYSGCKTNSTSAMMYSIIFLYRRMAFVIVTYYLRFNTSLQVIFLVITNMTYLCYLIDVKPLIDNLQMKLEIFNEFLFLILSVHLFWFQDPFADRETKDQMGRSLSTIIFTMIISTFSTVFGQIALKIYSTCKEKYAKRQREKSLKKTLRKQNTSESIKEKISTDTITTNAMLEFTPVREYQNNAADQHYHYRYSIANYNTRFVNKEQDTDYNLPPVPPKLLSRQYQDYQLDTAENFNKRSKLNGQLELKPNLQNLEDESKNTNVTQILDQKVLKTELIQSIEANSAQISYFDDELTGKVSLQRRPYQQERLIRINEFLIPMSQEAFVDQLEAKFVTNKTQNKKVQY